MSLLPLDTVLKVDFLVLLALTVILTFLVAFLYVSGFIVSLIKPLTFDITSSLFTMRLASLRMGLNKLFLWAIYRPVSPKVNAVKKFLQKFCF